MSLADFYLSTCVTELLEQITTDSTLEMPTVIQIDANSTLADALNTLSTNKLLAAPVFDTQANKYIGFVDMLDLSAFCLKEISQSDKTAGALSAMAHQVASSCVRACVDASHADPFVHVHRATSLKEVLGFFASGVHRLAVTETADSDRLIGVLSQSDAVSFVQQRLRELSADATRPLQSLGNLGMGAVLSVQTSDPALRAFERIALFRTSGCAVINDQTHIVDSFSATDLKGLTLQAFDSLTKPVSEFLVPIRRTSTVKTPVTCQPTSSFADVVDLIVTKKLHRVWLIDDANKPAGVVSLTDVCHALLHRLER